jgi:hypothetical protein
MLQFFEAEGYAVVKGALSPAEAAHALDLTWEYLESAGTGLARHDPGTWHEPAWLGRAPELGSFDSTNDYYGCHSKQMWYIRSRPALLKAWWALLTPPHLLSDIPLVNFKLESDPSLLH